MSRILSLLLLLVICVVLGFLAILPLSWTDQTILGILLIACAMLVNRFFPGQKSTIVLVLVACFCTSRYAYYRFSETFSNIQSGWSSLKTLDLIFVLALLFAEGYAFLILWLGAIQTIRPLKRQPLPLPKDPAEWPFVDVYIPTYNEPLEIVKTTVLAALSLDWPADRYAVYILDDGRRPEFKEFADSCSVGYIGRLDNAHAKAGNINNALQHTKGEHIAIFDCDHIPTRTFLQMTLGWMMADPRLAMVQTPHHFYSPDPFERNLQVFQVVPN
jgi:cellulose synthase (UDP-forming)